MSSTAGYRSFDPHRLRLRAGWAMRWLLNSPVADGAYLGTVRGAGTPLQQPRALERPDAVEIEMLDMTDHAQTRALRDRLAGRLFDIVFVNAGIANQSPGDTMAEVSTDEFVDVMVTNVLGVMRAVEELGVLARAGGMVGVMSSGQGSITQQHERRKRRLSRQQSGFESGDGQLCRPSQRGGSRDGPHGCAGLDPHGDGRRQCAVRRRGRHAPDRRHPHRTARRARPAIPRPQWPDRALVRRSALIPRSGGPAR